MEEVRLTGITVRCPVMETEVRIEDRSRIQFDIETNANYDSDLIIQVQCICGRVHQMSRRFE